MGIRALPFLARVGHQVVDGRALPLDRLADEMLAMRARRDADAFATLYDRYVDRIYQYARYRTRHTQDAEDLTSDVFFRALRAIDRYEPRAPFYAWIFRIARNAVIDAHRQKRDQVTLDDVASDTGAGAGDPEEHALDNDRRERLRRALANLSDDQQEVIVLRFIEGLSPDEVARAMGKRAGTVRGLQFRALKSLSRYISPKELSA